MFFGFLQSFQRDVIGCRENFLQVFVKSLSQGGNGSTYTCCRAASWMVCLNFTSASCPWVLPFSHLSRELQSSCGGAWKSFSTSIGSVNWWLDYNKAWVGLAMVGWTGSMHLTFTAILTSLSLLCSMVHHGILTPLNPANNACGWFKCIYIHSFLCIVNQQVAIFAWNVWSICFSQQGQQNDVFWKLHFWCWWKMLWLFWCSAAVLSFSTPPFTWVCCNTDVKCIIRHRIFLLPLSQFSWLWWYIPHSFFNMTSAC